MQTGHEKTLTGLLPALAGANLIYGLGMVELGMTFSFTQLVIDNEFAKMIKHTLKGIPVTDETLAVDVIGEVGPFGHFLDHDSTFKHMRETQSQPTLIDRDMRGDWEAAGGLDMSQRAGEVARKILETHTPDPLSAATLETLREIVSEAEKEFGVSS